MPAKKKAQMGEPCWVYFFNGIGQEPSWVKGFFATSEPHASDREPGLVITVEHDDYVTRDIPAWRVSLGLAGPMQAAVDPNAPAVQQVQAFPKRRSRPGNT